MRSDGSRKRFHKIRSIVPNKLILDTSMNDVFDGHFNQLIQTYNPDTTPMAFLLCGQQTLKVHIHFRHRFPKTPPDVWNS